MPNPAAARPPAQPWRTLVLSVALAAGLLGLCFAWSGGNFWAKTALSALVLAALSLLVRPPAPGEFRFRASDLAWGLAAAVALWLLFWLGKVVSTAVFPFAADQIGGIYAQGAGASPWLIALVIFLVTGPGEELFWRRYVQTSLQQRLGPGLGWLVGCLVYAGVHLASGNFMLMGAAGVAGAFFGLLYWKLGRIMPVLIAHGAWSAVIFALLPIP
ncbi:MAG: CPBP family intramembrane metalloprotease [Desulfarculaceae bacterium]|nr:CPBP family intramembrane metalloprotease [Desulfarculaceae bacterium]MCF8073882.1 CPBP family intramembrane metalloprotease [Desulfarculaceae bacterium]MCF8102862.1 CPBP family intramembrane metalloprotease [Desulfarculaceae bacterium]MCF8116306.1 CPBP family intramembrane metalloprotease [Desulfarculaceae bacterium]